MPELLQTQAAAGRSRLAITDELVLPCRAHSAATRADEDRPGARHVAERCCRLLSAMGGANVFGVKQVQPPSNEHAERWKSPPSSTVCRACRSPWSITQLVTQPWAAPGSQVGLLHAKAVPDAPVSDPSLNRRRDDARRDTRAAGPRPPGYHQTCAARFPSSWTRHPHYELLPCCSRPL